MTTAFPSVSPSIPFLSDLFPTAILLRNLSLWAILLKDLSSHSHFTHRCVSHSHITNPVPTTTSLTDFLSNSHFTYKSFSCSYFTYLPPTDLSSMPNNLPIYLPQLHYLPVFPHCYILHQHFSHIHTHLDSFLTHPPIATVPSRTTFFLQSFPSPILHSGSSVVCLRSS